MINRTLFSFGLFVVLSSSVVACGGDGKKAKSPESNAGITETSANKEDMPAPPSKDGDPNAAATGGDKDKDKAAGTSANNGAAGGMIKVAAMKLTPIKKGKNDKEIELKADGTLNVDGKPAAKFKGDQVDSTGGTSMVTVGVDGSLVGNGVKNGLKFEGDDLVNSDTGTKLSVADDGTINATTKDGKTEALAKAEGGGGAKRAALILLALYLSSEPAAAPATPAKKGPAAKPAEKTPAAAKPAGKKQKAAK